MIYEYNGKQYPLYLKEWNAKRAVEWAAGFFCVGDGVDVGAGANPLPGSMPVDLGPSPYHALNLPQNENREDGLWQYVFSSHCLEHIPNAHAALSHWVDRLVPGGCLFLYLPHHDMEYWRPENCHKHVHSFTPSRVAEMVRAVGLIDVIQSERDLYWSFSTVGWKRF